MTSRYVNPKGGLHLIISHLNRIHISLVLRLSVPLYLALMLLAPMPLAALPSGFQETVVFSGLNQPVAVRFAPDGSIFVAEKSGIVKVFDDLADTAPTIVADLRLNVYNGWDRGLLGLAIHPDFPNTPYIYVLYTFDADVGGTPPKWGDTCPDPPGYTNQGCTVSGRLSRLELDISTNQMTGAEQVLIEAWEQQFPSHSVGDLHFGPDGALYISAGDGASFNFVDYGQVGNPFDDPTNEGGALRSQDLQTAGDPVSLNGTVLRVDPETGEALADNPLYAGSTVDDDRIIAHGFRNPFRFTIHPQTGELYIGDVGWSKWEEINHIQNPIDAIVENFGWPCYEGVGRHPGYDGANLPICENLYSAGTVTAPLYPYAHQGSSAISGLAFYTGGDYPAQYDDALFFADYSARWIKVMFPSAGGMPDPANILTFIDNAFAVDLQIGPAGDVFYVDIASGQIRRIEYFSANQPPVAIAGADVQSGPSPLTVNFDGSGSYDPDPADTLSFFWDLDGDGDFDDSTLIDPQYTYEASGNYVAALRVTDDSGDSDTATIPITVDNSPPVATILSPSETDAWRVGDVIFFSGQGDDPDSGQLPPEAFTWQLSLQHCARQDPLDCHEHQLEEFSGVTSGQFTAIDHEYPSFMEIKLTVTDGGVADWWDSQWATRERLTFDNIDQSQDLINFPVLVRLDSSRIDYSQTSAQGKDLRFVDADGTLLAYEIESWNVGGTSIVWVQAPNIEANSDSDYIWLYYGNPAAAEGQEPAAVWDATFAGVWHFNGDLLDATTNMNDGIDFGNSMDEVANAAGPFGGARSFNGIDDYIEVGSNISLEITGQLTLEAWIKIADPDQAGAPRVLSKKFNWNDIGYNLEYKPGDNNLTSVGSGPDWARADGVDLDTNWHYVGAAIDGATGAMYVDGIDLTTDSSITPLEANAQPLNIGRRGNGGDYFWGSIDEVRISNVARSADWMAAQYLSMTDAFITFAGSQDRVGLSDTATVAIYPQTTILTLESNPPGLELGIYAELDGAPYNIEAIAGSQTAVAAPSPQIINNVEYVFSSWSDGGAQNHNITIADSDQTLVAQFTAVTNQPPTVSIASPVPLQNINPPGNIAITADASDPDGSVARVDFYVNGQFHSSDSTSPYATDWNASSPGAYVLTAVATDLQNASTTSSNVAVTVGGNPNQDSDEDAISDVWELQHGLNPGDPGDASSDADGDGLTSLDEFDNQTDPNLADTDGDTFDDGLEVDNGTDPNNSSDYPTPAITIDSPADGATIIGDTIVISYTLAGYFATGDHVHWTLDAPPHISEMDRDGSFVFTGVAAGSHTITAHVSSQYHVPYGNHEARASITVTLGAPDTAAPTPDPMRFASPPAAAGPDSIAMTAATASDESGVEYYFTCTAGACHDSGWQSSTTYTDTGLSGSTQYTYTVKARDLSPNRNEAAASADASATTAAVAFDPISINFQQSSSPVPPGYLMDAGNTYGDRGNGYTYGWSADVTAHSRDRGVHSDQRYDTLIHMHKGSSKTWELDIPNGSYVIEILMGDPSFTNQVNNILIEGTSVVDPDGQDNFDLHTGIRVTVSDGKLTIVEAGDAVNTKLCYINISKEYSFDPIYVNFQQNSPSVPPGYLMDAGNTYGDRGNGYTYGWSADVAADSRDRGAHSDQRYDTLIHMHKGSSKTWELEIPNGSYVIEILMGDPSYTDQVNNILIEGTSVVDPDGQDNFDLHTGIRVTVSDGKLTLVEAGGADNTKLCYINISEE